MELAPIAIADLLDISAFAALLLIMLVVGRYFIQCQKESARFMEKLATDALEAMRRITQENAELMQRYTIAMQELTRQIQNNQKQAQQRQDDLQTRMREEHARTREEVRGLRGRLGKGNPDEANH